MYLCFVIYHLTTEELLQKALDTGYYTHPSLKLNGCIRCLPKEMVLSTADCVFADFQEVILISILEKRIGKFLKWENAENSENQTPNVYCSIPVDAIESIDIVEKDNTGKFIWPEKG